MTPISCRLTNTEWGGLRKHDWSKAQELFASDGAHNDGGSLFIPIRLRTDVGRDCVVTDAISQVLEIADRLQSAFPDIP